MLQKISHISPGAERLLASAISVIFILTLIPIFWIAFYDRPSADDISYGWQTKQVFLQTGSLIETIKTAFQAVTDVYQNWQGTFSAVFLFSLQPAIIGEAFYAVTPFIMLGMLTFSTLLMLRTLFREWRYAIIAGCVMLFLSIQYPPSVVEGFFWYNGAVFYTFFYSAFLLCFSGQLRLLYLSNKTADHTFFFKTLLYSIFGFLIGGGNYVTALLQVIVIFAATIFCFFSAKSARLKAAFCLFTFSALSGLLLSLSAPGNEARQLHFSQPSISSAILSSFQQAFHDITDWFTIPAFCMLILLIPLFYTVASSLTFTFRFPVLVMIASFCIFSAQNMPPIYAMENPGPDRLRNIIYFSYIWLLIGNAFYLTGWVSACFQMRARMKSAAVLCTVFLYGYTAFLCGWTVWENVERTTSYRCANDLLQGTARQRLTEYNERLKILNDENIFHAELDPFTVIPDTIALPTDYKTTDEASLNSAGARYYGKKSIVLRSGDAQPTHMARVSPSGLWIDEKAAPITLYLIDQGASHYASIDDMAHTLAGSSKAFDIHYDNQADVMVLRRDQTNTASVPVSDGTTGDKKAIPVHTSFLIDYQPVDIRAYRINDEILVKLQDMAQALDFTITYNPVMNMVELYT